MTQRSHSLVPGCNTIAPASAGIRALAARHDLCNAGGMRSIVISCCAFLLGLTGCTTLGPMPAMTGQTVVPAPRAGVEGQVAAIPGYYLSSSVQESPKGTPVNQASLMVEPGELIGVEGLSAGARYVGKNSQGGYLEPMLRYRAHLDREKVFAAGVVGYGTYATGDDRGASYSAARGGAEVGADVRATPESRWLELHLAGSVGLTALSAKGEYCVDQQGRYAVDCGDPPTTLTKASAKGFYPSAGGAIALDLGHHLDGVLHGGRIAALGAVGKMPRVESGEQKDAKTYVAAGLAVTLGLGAAK